MLKIKFIVYLSTINWRLANMYKKMYYRLFNAITEAMGHILRMEYGETYGILARAQAETEELYLAGEET